ncbi:MAG: chemotaxis protein CheD [Lachnospiraceae bacterium]|nr:chemotaxis protein CheD [Lachnospiraceae bacterium]
MSEIIKVGMADLKVCASPDGLTTLGLGSCVGIAIRDPMAKIGGLAHIMLPNSSVIRGSEGNIAKFADTGIVELVRQMEAKGAKRNRMTAKLAGGAMMFAFQNKSELGRVGDKNVDASKQILAKLGIPILAEDTRENYGRTVIFYPETGDYVIKAVGKPEKII